MAFLFLEIIVRALNCISKSTRENCVRPPYNWFELNETMYKGNRESDYKVQQISQVPGPQFPFRNSGPICIIIVVFFKQKSKPGVTEKKQPWRLSFEDN